MVQSDALNQSGSIARQYRGTANVEAEDFPFPFKICLVVVDGLVREGDGVVHAACRTKKGGD